MAVSRSFTEQIDTLYTTTFQLRKSKIYDQIFKITPFWNMMGAKGRMMSQTGGRYIEIPVQKDENTTVQFIGPAATVSLDDVDPLSASKWDWKYLTGLLVREFTQEQKNRGKAAILKIVTAKIDNLRSAFTQVLETSLFGDGTGTGGLATDGLGNIIAENPTIGTVGGFDRSTETWFRNQFKDMAGDTVSVVLLKRMETMWNDCGIFGQGIQRFPDLIICAQDVYEAHNEEAREIQQIVVAGSGKQIADLGFGEQNFKGAPITFSPECPAGSMYFINTEALEWTSDPMENMTLGNWIDIPNQPRTRVAHAMLIGNLTCNTPRKLGVLFNMVIT